MTNVRNITMRNVTDVFQHHELNEDQAARQKAIYNAACQLAQTILYVCQESPERSAALRDVQRAAAMARVAIELERLM